MADKEQGGSGCERQAEGSSQGDSSADTIGFTVCSKEHVLVILHQSCLRHNFVSGSNIGCKGQIEGVVNSLNLPYGKTFTSIRELEKAFPDITFLKKVVGSSYEGVVTLLAELSEAKKQKLNQN